MNSRWCDRTRASTSDQPVGCVPGKPPGSADSNPSPSSSPSPGTAERRTVALHGGQGRAAPPHSGVPRRPSAVKEDRAEAKGGPCRPRTGGSDVCLDSQALLPVCMRGPGPGLRSRSLCNGPRCGFRCLRATKSKHFFTSFTKTGAVSTAAFQSQRVLHLEADHQLWGTDRSSPQRRRTAEPRGLGAPSQRGGSCRQPPRCRADALCPRGPQVTPDGRRVLS